MIMMWILLVVHSWHASSVCSSLKKKQQKKKKASLTFLLNKKLKRENFPPGS